MSRFFAFLFVCSLLGPAAFASTSLDEEFEAIKNSGKNFEVSGTVCEEVARVQFASDYREPSYTVRTGITYGDADQGVVGELDVIIFDNRSRSVVKIAEVKCWRDFKSGLAKAHEQRRRFLSLLHASQSLFFKSTSGREEFPPEQFAALKDFASVGQKGAVASGFDFELSETLEELMTLRDRMLECQGRGRCPKNK